MPVCTPLSHAESSPLLLAHLLRRLTHGEHPVAGEGLWGTQREVPSFLYAMPVANGRVFLEETCLVAKPPLPFNVLKRRLERRLGAMGLKVQSLLLTDSLPSILLKQLFRPSFCLGHFLYWTAYGRLIVLADAACKAFCGVPWLVLSLLVLMAEKRDLLFAGGSATAVARCLT